ncbi:MAG: hypothetical protein ACOCW8_00670 [bacterium]
MAGNKRIDTLQVDGVSLMSLLREEEKLAHEMQFFIYLNDIPVARQLCLIDVSTHQLKFTGEGNTCGLLKEPATKPVTLRVNRKKSYQTILGFGGITAVPAYNQLSNEGKKNSGNMLYGSFSRYIHQGMKRIEAYSNDSDLLVSAYYGDNHETLVIINRSPFAKTIDISKTATKFTKYGICSPYLENKDNKLEKDNIIIQGGEIITLHN